MRFLSVIGKLYGPPFVVCATLFVAIFAEQSAATPPHLKMVPFEVGLFEFDVPVPNLVLVRALLGCIAGLFLLMMLFSDYSRLFPHTLEMDVFFDPEGIEATLGQVLAAKERKELAVPADYRPLQAVYYRDLDLELERVISQAIVFQKAHHDVHSEGDTTFIVEKVGGFQRYHLRHSEGRLFHTLERAQQPPVKFMTFFEKRSSAADYLEPNLLKLAFGGWLLMRPVFNQILAENMRSSGKVFHHSITGATRVRIYPWPRHSNTLYLAEVQGTRVPIGYSVYR